jgi:rhodanese-related sulfurtransferase
MVTVRRAVSSWLVTVAVLVPAAACGADDGAGAAGGGGPTRPASAAAEPVAGVGHLDARAFTEAVARPGTVVLDVRTPAEFAQGHLPNAVNLDMQAADFPARIAQLDRSGAYALYCRSGHRSGQAGELMRAAGFTNVVDLAGGVAAWTAAGGALVTS